MLTRDWSGWWRGLIAYLAAVADGEDVPGHGLGDVVDQRDLPVSFRDTNAA
jgi:hypothetical protein